MSRTFRNRITSTLALTGLLGALVVASTQAQAADHLEAPAATVDGRTDITDLYAFQSPSNPDNTVIALAVNPLAGVENTTTFKPGASYQIFVGDEEGRGTKFRFRFGRVRKNGSQKMGMWIDRKKVATGRTGRTSRVPGGTKVRAGVFDDPFFFDLTAFGDQVKGAGGSRTFCDGNEVDFLAGLNVNAIVLEVPSDTFDGTNVAIWARTRTKRGVIDRVGRPAIATVLIPDGSEDAYNRTKPRRDNRKWGADVKASLLALSGLDGSPYSDAEAQGITDFLLPDVMTFDTSSADGFPNGRGLADDVIDAELGIVTGGFFGGSAVLTSDCVDANDVPFRSSFPYLAPAQ